MSYDPYITAGNVVISKTDDVYTVVVNGKDMYIDGVSGKTLKATFEGAINGAGNEDEGGNTDETIELTSAVATAAGSSYIGGTGYNLTFSDGNGTEIVYMVQTLGNTYLKEGEWNGDYSWSEEGYINTVTWTNVNTAWPYTMTVAVADGAYDITLQIVDYYGSGQPTLTAHYAGQIEGFTLPGAGDDVEDGVIAMTSMGAMEKIGSYSAGVLLSDDSGNNQVKLAVDEFYSWDSTNNFPKANAYDKYVSSPSYIMDGSDFSFVNKTLVVNGTTYASDEVTAATLTVVENTSITITFTVAGEEYTFQYNK